jgi:hypothetical protein
LRCKSHVIMRSVIKNDASWLQWHGWSGQYFRIIYVLGNPSGLFFWGRLNTYSFIGLSFPFGYRLHSTKYMYQVHLQVLTYTTSDRLLWLTWSAVGVFYRPTRSDYLI